VRQGRSVKAVGKVLVVPAVEERKPGRGLTRSVRARLKREAEERGAPGKKLLPYVPTEIPVVKIGVKGCPTVTEDHLVIIETALSKGFPYSRIADLLGIHKSTFSQWIGRRPHIHKRLKKAEALHITRALEVIDAAAPKSWQAAAWRLERREREDFGQQSNVNVAGAVANVHFTAADAAVLVAATKAKFAGSSDTDRTTIDVTPEKSGKPIVAAERHLKDKPAG